MQQEVKGRRQEILVPIKEASEEVHKTSPNNPSTKRKIKNKIKNIVINEQFGILKDYQTSKLKQDKQKQMGR